MTQLDREGVEPSIVTPEDSAVQRPAREERIPTLAAVLASDPGDDG
jgi:hypothetical protein